MISASLVKDLREKTGAGMLDCKKALEATNGDFNAAVDWLREKGISTANKKASRIAAEGVAAIKVDGNNVLFMYDYEKEGDNPIKPDNLLAIKSALRVVLGLDEINLDVKKYNPKEKRPAIDTIKELFGADLVTIKKQ